MLTVKNFPVSLSDRFGSFPVVTLSLFSIIRTISLCLNLPTVFDFDLSRNFAGLLVGISSRALLGIAGGIRSGHSGKLRP